MMRQQRCRGFTLTELSVVLVVIALLVGMSISATIPILQQARINATTKKMTTIEQALLKFSAANGRIPCPADLTLTQGSTNYGQEAGYAAGGVGTGECQHNLTPAANFATATTGGTAEGGVPTAALSLPNDFMYDGWGHKFRYVVDPTYTLSTQHSAWPIPSYIGCTSSSTSITVNDESGVARTQKAIYVIISHGANGHGAYTASGQTFNAGIKATDEQTNCHCDATGAHTGGAGVLASATYVQKDPQYQSGQSNQPLYYFDDIVTYKENWQMQTVTNPPPSSCPYLWIADSGNHRVLKLTQNGTFVAGFGSSYNGESHTVGTSGSSPQRLNHPTAATLDSSGNTWVMDEGNNRIMKFNSSGTWQMTIGGNTTTDTCAGTYATSTTCNKLSGYTNCCAPNAGSCTCSSGSANGQFNVSGFSGPAQIAFDTSGNLWATDYGNNRVQEFNSSTGAYMSAFTVGSCPSGITVDKNNNIWVSSDCSNHIQKCTTGGSCTTINPPTLGSNWANNYVTFDPNSGNIWANDEGGSVYEFSSSGSYLGTLSNSHSTELDGIFFDNYGYLWIADDTAHVLYKIVPNTSNILLTIGTGTSGTGTNPVQFHNPQNMFISSR
jgi:prepilin-type N-terminal cleavage/methylation domain-containing protein